MMITKALDECEEFVAGDGTNLREVLHPANDSVEMRYSLAHAYVRPGESSLPHRLAGSEAYYILEGVGVMHVNGETADIRAGCAIYVPPQATQHIQNTGATDLKFLCIVDPAWRAEDEEVRRKT
ncbi:MAG TPA: cupin domain-containing protein [Chloroflexia bacterium]|jgi:mannose-6-phosphate isomerase-like protein (cupin superfamily)